MSFLDLEGKVYLVVGFANRKSIAWSVSKSLMEEGARVLFSVRSEKRKNELLTLLPEAEIFVCDFEKKQEVQNLAEQINQSCKELNGILHSIAFANYSEGLKPFHETERDDFLQATQISSFSLVELANSCKNILASFKLVTESCPGSFSCRLCWNYHVWLAWHHQLWRHYRK
jgi:enoyl-[acyl-carrier protein] reductase I